jgi:hypothetical protein
MRADCHADTRKCSHIISPIGTLLPDRRVRGPPCIVGIQVCAEGHIILNLDTSIKRLFSETSLKFYAEGHIHPPDLVETLGGDTSGTPSARTSECVHVLRLWNRGSNWAIEGSSTRISTSTPLSICAGVCARFCSHTDSTQNRSPLPFYQFVRACARASARIAIDAPCGACIKAQGATQSRECNGSRSRVQVFAWEGAPGTADVSLDWSRKQQLCCSLPLQWLACWLGEIYDHLKVIN